MNEGIDTHNVRINYGKHGPKGGKQGELFTRLPLSYLRWMVNNGAPMDDYAAAELNRRGCSELPKVEVSGHAIDRASLRALKIWRKTCMEDEGLNAWLMRMTEEAPKRGKKINDEKYEYHGMSLVIATGGFYPILKTVTVNNAR